MTFSSFPITWASSAITDEFSDHLGGAPSQPTQPVLGLPSAWGRSPKQPKATRGSHGPGLPLHDFSSFPITWGHYGTKQGFVTSKVGWFCLVGEGGEFDSGGVPVGMPAVAKGRDGERN